MKKYYVQAEAAKRLGIHRTTLFRWEREGKIAPSARMTGKYAGRRAYTDDDLKTIREWMGGIERPAQY